MPSYPVLSDLLVDGDPTPAGRHSHPTFSWTYFQAEGLPQYAWHIQVATSQELLDADNPDVANLQEESSLSCTRYPEPSDNDPYFATALSDVKIYFWRCRARTAADNFQPWEEQ